MAVVTGADRTDIQLAALRLPVMPYINWLGRTFIAINS